jgi:ribosomal subunit interface protein
MKVLISGKQVELGDSLHGHIEAKLQAHVKKFFSSAIRADVKISKENSFFATEIRVYEGTGTGVIINAHGEDSDPYRSFDQALHKIDSQLNRYKKRIKNHHHHKLEPAEIAATRYIIPPLTEGSNDYEEDYSSEDNPVVIAEEKHEVPKLSVQEAVMRMDLLHLPALLYVNKASNCLNLVYYRHDGNISWLDTDLVPTKK